MKFRALIIPLVSVLILSSGCDAVRSLLGKPTSEDLAEMKTILEQRAKARADSLSRAAEAVRSDSLQQASDTLSTLSIRKYNVIAGAFSEEANAGKLTKSLEEAGYRPFAVNFRNGMHAVCVMSSDQYDLALRFLSDFRASFEQGQDAWIYNSTTGKHIPK